MYCKYIEHGSAGAIGFGGFARSTSPTSFSSVIDCGSAVAAKNVSNTSSPVDLDRTFIAISDLLRDFSALRETALTLDRKVAKAQKGP
jgi:hypothetical protein